MLRIAHISQQGHCIEILANDNQGNGFMKITPILIAACPAAIVVGAVVNFNPAILTWPVVVGLGIFLGLVGGVVNCLVEPMESTSNTEK